MCNNQNEKEKIKCKGIVTRIKINNENCYITLQTDQQYKSIEIDENKKPKNTLNLFEMIEQDGFKIKQLNTTEEFIISKCLYHCIEFNKKYIFTLENQNNSYIITEIEIC